ncbi:hypothetical protein MKZ38_002284 [Zalerion maritima]|uniref:Heterokaryon incompatibility domain-containing protein n=1 Tax=Zalerion maritima TaxID=339359 RepID=A0AAD5WT75_9PEZI|nr:hypothetical protein MKZ38_002284 [Zalerion maritima]
MSWIAKTSSAMSKADAEKVTTDEYTMRFKWVKENCLVARETFGEDVLPGFDLNALEVATPDQSDLLAKHAKLIVEDAIGERLVSETERLERDPVASQCIPADSMYYGLELPPGAIRLLRLLPGAAGDKIQCELFVSSGPSAVLYEALSYVWGVGTPPRTIMANSLECSVTPNLLSALSSLRLEDGPRILWTDALCINQQNKKEKAIQVARMGDIYKRADRVVVYFGDSDEGTDRLFDFIEAGQDEVGLSHPLDQTVENLKMASHLTRNLIGKLDALATKASADDSVPAGLGIDGTVGDARPPNAAHADSPQGGSSFEAAAKKRGFDPVPILKAFIELLFRPWWTRAWVVQETCLTQKDPLMFCGRRSIPASSLSAEMGFLLPLISAGISTDTGSLAFALPSDTPASRVVDRMMAARKALNTMGLNYPLPQGVFYQQTMFQSRDCSDPRDRVFAFRSLMDPIFQEICYPDYRQSEVGLYKKHAAYILAYEGYADVLCRFPLGRFKESWVPDFSKPFSRQGADIFAFYEHMCLHNGVLGAKAILWDTIEATQNISGDTDTDLIGRLWMFEQDNWECREKYSNANKLFPPELLLQWAFFSLGGLSHRDLVSWLVPEETLNAEAACLWGAINVGRDSNEGDSVKMDAEQGGSLSASASALQAAKRVFRTNGFAGCALFDYENLSKLLEETPGEASDGSQPGPHVQVPGRRGRFYRSAAKVILEQHEHTSRREICTLLLILADRIRDMVYPDPVGRKLKEKWPTMGKAATVDGPLQFKHGHPELVKLIDVATQPILKDLGALRTAEMQARQKGDADQIKEASQKRQAQEFILNMERSKLLKQTHVVDLKRKEVLDRLRNRQWFVTEAGHAGVGVDQTRGFEAGDVVAMFAGTSLPVVVRIDGDDSKFLKFVGPLADEMKGTEQLGQIKQAVVGLLYVFPGLYGRSR